MIIDKDNAAVLLNEYKIRFFPPIRKSTEILGKHATFERRSQHLPGRFMPLGAYSYSQSFFSQVSRIGRYCSIGSNVTVMGDKHPTEWLSSSPVFYRQKRARFWGSDRIEFPKFDAQGSHISIDNDVWVGDDVTLAHGVHLGTGCVVATGSVVTKDVSPYTIVGGAPARVIRKRFDDALVKDLLASCWWCLPVSVWDEIDPTSPSEMLNHLNKIRAMTPDLPEDRFSISRLISSSFAL